MPLFKAINLGATTIGAGATQNADLVVDGYSQLVIMARIGNGTTPATAAGDVVISVAPYEDDGTTVSGAALTPTTAGTAVLGSNVADIVQTYDLHGIEKLQVRLKNNNAGALQGGTVVAGLKASNAI